MSHYLRITNTPVFENGATKESGVLDYVDRRLDEIERQISVLQAESRMLATIADAFLVRVCDVCVGSGHVMRHIPGCECDGPRMHTCDKCNGTGKAK